jgi:hypothetical protein
MEAQVMIINKTIANFTELKNLIKDFI